MRPVSEVTRAIRQELWSLSAVVLVASWTSVAPALPQNDAYWLARYAEGLHRQGHVAEAERLLQQASQRWPDRLPLQVALARLAAAQGQTQYALGLLQEVLRLDSRCVEAWLARAELLRQQNRISEAMQDLETALRNNPSPELAERTRGLLRLMQGNWEAAIVHLTRYLNQSDGEDAEAFCWRGQAWLRSGRADHAEADFARALQIHPGLSEIWRLRAQALEEQGQLQKAAAAYERAVQAAPQDLAIRLAYAKVLYRLRSFHECSTQLEAVLRLEPRHREALELLVQTARALHQPRVLLTAIDRLLEIQNSDPSLWFRKALALESLCREPEALQALAECEKLFIQNNPNDRQQLAPLFFAGRARLLAKLDRLNEALADVNEAIQRSPRYAYAYRLRADIRWRLGRIPEALADLDTAQQIQPDDEFIFIKRAELLRAQGKWDAALQELDRAVQVSPQTGSAHTQRAGMLLLLGRWEEAARQLAQVPGDDEEHPSTLAYAQAIQAALQGDWQLAERIAEQHLAGFATDPMSTYNLACAWAIFADLRLRRGRAPVADPHVVLYKRRALDLLEKTFALGYKDCWHTRHDPDLFVLHREPAFWRLVKANGQVLTRP